VYSRYYFENTNYIIWNTIRQTRTAPDWLTIIYDDNAISPT